MRYKCKCGETFSDRRKLVEHIGLLNPHWPRSTSDDWHGDAEPFVASIEETERKATQYGFHLGTDIAIACGRIEEIYKSRLRLRMPVITIALMRYGKVVNVYDGKWAND